MSDIEEPMAAYAVAWRNQNPPGAGQSRPGPRERRRQRLRPYATGEAHADIADAVSLFGVEARDLGPDLKEMLIRVAGEIETLRSDLDRAEQHEQFLEQQIHRHPVFPVLNIRAFRHHLDGLLRALESNGVSATLALFYLDNHEDLRRRFGLKAADACLQVLLQSLQETVRATDMIGGVGPAGFLVLFHPAETDGVRRKIRSVVNAVSGQTLKWEGATLPLQVIAGVRDLHRGDETEAVLDELDQQIRRPWA